jgi:hypothetical protein
MSTAGLIVVAILLVAFVAAVLLVSFGAAIRDKAEDYLPQDTPELDDVDLTRIQAEARDAGRSDHARGILSDRLSPYPHRSQANAVWTIAYLELRSTLEETARARERSRFEREVS